MNVFIDRKELRNYNDFSLRSGPALPQDLRGARRVPPPGAQVPQGRLHCQLHGLRLRPGVRLPVHGALRHHRPVRGMFWVRRHGQAISNLFEKDRFPGIECDL